MRLTTFCGEMADHFKTMRRLAFSPVTMECGATHFGESQLPIVSVPEPAVYIFALFALPAAGRQATIPTTWATAVRSAARTHPPSANSIHEILSSPTLPPCRCEH